MIAPTDTVKKPDAAEESSGECRPEDLPKIDAMVERIGQDKYHVIPILHEIQELFGWLCRWR